MIYIDMADGCEMALSILCCAGPCSPVGQCACLAGLTAVLEVFMEPKTKLLDQMRLVLRLKHLSPRTEHAYITWAKRFIVFHGKRHPKDMGAEEIRAFLTYLALHRHVAASTQNV